MSANSIFNGYWLGYQPNGNTLNETPSYINTVTLFVAAPTSDNTLGVNYLCKAYPQEQQIEWVQQLQSQGAEVLMSLMDTSTVHWNDVDINAFVGNVVDVAINGPWGLNGIDIDLESGMPGGVWASTFTELITKFRSALGPLGSTNSKGQSKSRLSVAAYRPWLEQPVLEACGGYLDWLNTMAYGDDAQGTESLFSTYKQWVQQVNLGIGVYYQDGQSTPLATASSLAQWASQQSGCGMMEFGLNNDCPNYTQQPQWTWASSINAKFGGQSAAKAIAG